MSKLYIYAPNIHTGGGRSLIVPLLRGLSKKGNVIAYLDSRLEDIETGKTLQVYKIQRSLMARFNAERDLRKRAISSDHILFFGNLPPISKINSKTTLYLQNRLLLGDNSYSGFTIRTKIRLMIEKNILKFFHKNVDRVLVQTRSMQQLVELNLKRHSELAPFFDKQYWSTQNITRTEKKYDFIYVASPEPQKNHRKLIAAWINLARHNIRPSLCLTLDDSSDSPVVRYILQAITQNGLDIHFSGLHKNVDMKQLYSAASALIYPSKIESLGLPLLEAKACGLTILASDCQYVKDIVSPDYVFNPDCEFSIESAIKLFMGINAAPQQILDVDQFIRQIENQ